MSSLESHLNLFERFVSENTQNEGPQVGPVLLPLKVSEVLPLNPPFFGSTELSGNTLPEKRKQNTKSWGEAAVHRGKAGSPYERPSHVSPVRREGFTPRPKPQGTRPVRARNLDVWLRGVLAYFC